MDRRTEYTKKVIKDGFLSCLSGGEFSKLTIKDICAEAGINRSTFYLHYHRLDDVLEQLLDEAFSEVGTMFDQYDEAPAQEPCRYPLCRFIREKGRYKPIFLDNSLSEYLIGKMACYFKADYIRRISARGEFSPADAETIFWFQIHGCFASALRNIDKSDAEWRQMKNTIDTFLWKDPGGK
mgnify:CR=1 FL=1